jgi:hypothetical protein
MKSLNRSLLALGVALGTVLIISGCFSPSGTAHKAKSRVIVAAHNLSQGSSSARALRVGTKSWNRSRAIPTSQAKLGARLLKTKVFSAHNLSALSLAAASQPKPGKRPAKAKLAAGRPKFSGARDLSASTDIDYITYQVDNLDPNSGEDSYWDYVDPYDPYLDLFMTPGQSYRITIEVTLLSDSPIWIAGQTVGIYDYGDSAEVQVPDDGSDVWVDMMVHPMGDAFQSQVTSGTQIGVWDAMTGTLSKTQALSSALTPSPADKVFYTSDSLLYYFNEATNAVYQWPDITKPIDTSSTPYFSGTALQLTMYALCADPVWPGVFWAVGQNTTDQSWEYDMIDTTSQSAYYTTITDDLVQNISGSDVVVVPTGIAADYYGDAYISFYNTGLGGTGHPISGVIEYDYEGTAYAWDIPDTTSAWTSADSIVTDLVFSGGSLYVLASPNTSAGAVSDHNKGRADIKVYDSYMDSLVSNPTAIAQTFSGSGSISTTGSALSLPNKFAGLVESGYLLISQSDFVTGGTEDLSAVSLDLTSVYSLP